MAEQNTSTTISEPTKPATSLFDFFGTSKKGDLPKNKGEPKQSSKKGYVTRSTRKIATKLLSMKHKVVNIMNNTINDLVRKMDCKPKIVRRTRKRKNSVLKESLDIEEPIAVEESIGVEEPKTEMIEEEVMGTEEPSVLESESKEEEIGEQKILGGKRYQKKVSKRKYPKK